VFSQELVVHSGCDGEFTGVVSSSDGLNIPLDETVLEDAADVVNEAHEEESNEDGHAANVKASNLSVVHLLIHNAATNLDKEQCLHGAALTVVGAQRGTGGEVLSRVGECAVLLTIALSSQVSLECFKVVEV
jgi:hypothetical protein